MKNNLIKTLLCFLCLLFAVGVGFSQVGFGTKVGVNFSNVSISGFDIDTKGKTDLSIGLLFEIPVSEGFIIQPELTYMGRGYKANILSTESTTNVAYVDIGGLLKGRFGDDLGVYVAAGPFFSYAVSGKIDDDDIDFDVDRYKRSDFTLAGVLGVEFGSRDALRFFVDARYLLGLTDIFEGDQTDFTTKNKSIGLNGGIIIPLGG